MYNAFIQGREVALSLARPRRFWSSTKETNNIKIKNLTLENRRISLWDLVQDNLTNILGFILIATRLIPKQLNFLLLFCKSFWPKTHQTSLTKGSNLLLWLFYVHKTKITTSRKFVLARCGHIIKFSEAKGRTPIHVPKRYGIIWPALE